MENEVTYVSPVRRFFRGLLRIAKAYFLTLGILVSILPVLTFYAIYRMQSAPHHGAEVSTSLPDQFILSIDADGSITTEQSSSPSWMFRKWFAVNRDVSINLVRSSLREAVKDKRIKGLILRINTLGGSLTDFIELRRLIEKFKTDSKLPVYVSLSSGNNSEYLLASIGDKIALSPGGGLEIPGPVLQMTYFAEALKKLGVEFDVIQAGRYKSAFEPFIKQGPSPESLEALQAMENSLRQVLIQTVASSRNKPVEQIAGWFKQSEFVAKDAVDAGLVDAVAHPDEFSDEFFITTAVKEDVAVQDYYDSEDLSKTGPETGEGLGVIYALGEVLMTSTGGYNEEIVPARLKEELEWMADNEDVKAVVLRIDSPGGSATASELIWQHIQKLVAKKPVIVSMGSVAASGGYYIAAPASKVIAEPSTITGSIGVISAIPKTPGFAEKWGISFSTITQSDRKAMFDPATPLSPFDRALMESSIASIYTLFKQRVAKGRSIPIEKVDEIAQGRVYTGVQALELGLVDDLGGMTEAFQTAKQLGSLDPNKLYPVYQYEGEDFDLSSCLRSAAQFYKCIDKMQSRIGLKAPLSPVSAPQELLQSISQLRTMAEQDRILVYGSFGGWYSGSVASRIYSMVQ